MNKKNSFIPHLEGIRGIAILLVLFFHLGITAEASPIALPGGYLGVEIFLVLSGFLLALGLSRKQESFLDFARKKLLRIMWPICVTVLLTLLVCLFCMDFADLTIAGRNALWSTFASNNIQLSESGAEYFADDSTWNPLLHTWYIAITVQIYLLFYIGYRLIRKWNKGIRYTILLLIALFSFFYGQCHEWRMELIQALGLPVWMGNQGSMYYSTIARLWEPLAGAAVLFMPVSDRKWLNSLLSAVAIAAIAVCVWLQPAQAMLFVAIASMILIRYGGENGITYLFNNKLIRSIGAISFSIYLVHMPIIVCHKCISFMPIGYAAAVIILLGSLAAGWLFWLLVEKRRASLLLLGGVWVSCIALATTLLCTDGLKNHWNCESNNLVLATYPHLRQEEDPTLYVGFDKEKIWYYQGWITQTGVKLPREKRKVWMHRLGVESKTPSFVLMGDSHAGHYVTGLDTLCKENDVAGINLTTLVVPFWNRLLPEQRTNYYFNKEKAEAILSWLKQHPELTHIIIGQLWDRPKYLKQDWDNNTIPTPLEETNLPMLREFCQQLKSIGKQVIIMGPEPIFQEQTPMRYFRYLKRNGYTSADKPHPKCICNEENYFSMFSKIIDYMNQMQQDDLCQVLYPHLFLFEQGQVGLEKQGVIIYRDDEHLSVTGSEYVIRAMWKDLSKALNITNSFTHQN